MSKWRSHVGFICKSSERVKNDENKDHFALRETDRIRSHVSAQLYFSSWIHLLMRSATLPVFRRFMTPSSLTNISPFLLNQLEQISFNITHWSLREYSYPHIVDEETNSESLNKFLKIMQIAKSPSLYDSKDCTFTTRLTQI